MCDYSVMAERTREAKVGDRLITSKFGLLGHTGFRELYGDRHTAVCLRPGTELAFDDPVPNPHHESNERLPKFLSTTAKFTQINKGKTHTMHDVIEFNDNQSMWLGYVPTGQIATILQLPAKPKTVKEAAAQKRAAYAG